MLDVDASPDVLLRTLARERRARKAAEALLEQKSRELYETHNELLATASDLHIEAERTRTILQTAAEAIITFGRDGVIETVNPAAECIFSYDAAKFVGIHVRDLIATDAVDLSSDHHWWTELPGISQSPRAVIGRRQDGEEFHMELSGSRVEFEDRLIHTWILRDVTERISLERQLSFAQKLESVGQLAAGIAHEINTPIQFVGDNLAFMEKAFEKWGAIYECHEALHQQCQKSEDYRELCQEITNLSQDARLDFLRAELPSAIQQSLDGTSRVGKIVRAMKEFSHPGVQSKAKTDLNKAIESTVTVSRSEWKYFAEVETDLDPNLPHIPCFPGDLNQAILNLVVNAAQAIGEKVEGSSEQGVITIRTRRHNEKFVEISVSDTGAGMSAEVRERIFDPFFTTKPVGKGTGQGLAITFTVVVERHSGTIHVESTPDKGTTFFIRLPIAENQ